MPLARRCSRERLAKALCLRGKREMGSCQVGFDTLLFPYVLPSLPNLFLPPSLPPTLLLQLRRRRR